MIIRMAYRNIFRHRTRSLLTLVSLAFGIFIVILGVGLNLGMERHIIKITRDVSIGDYKLYKKGYFDDRFENADSRLDFMIDNNIDSILEKYNFSKRTVFQGTITTDTYDYPVKVIGGNIKDEEKLFQRTKYLLTGKEGVVLASKLAKNLNLKVGDPFVLQGITAMGSVNAKDFIVTGIMETGSFEFDTGTVLIEKNVVDEFIETNGFNDVVIKGHISDIDLEKLDTLGVEVVTYLEELKDLIAITRIKLKVTFIFGSIILLISGVGIINTMLMAMLERKKEVGILMANGIKPNTILKLFVLEGAIMGGIGSGIGFITGGALLYYYEIVGIALPEMADKMGTAIPLSNRVYGYFDWRLNILFLIFGILIAMFSSLYPAYKATQLEPIDVIWDR
jgi:putative ABC transport system permease protein